MVTSALPSWSPDGTTAPPPGLVVSPRLVGRIEELSRLADAVTAAPAVVVVEGEAGIGKTRLVNELASLPDLAGRRIVTGWCRRIREPFPLGAVIEAVRTLSEDLARTTLSPVAGALRPLLPEIAHLLPPRPPPLDDRAAERHRVFRGLVDVLRALGPTVLVLEDLHWADEQTVDFLSYLLGSPPSALSVVVTYRDDEVGPDLRALTTRLPAPVQRAQLRLGPLSEVETGRLAAAILDTARMPVELASYLHQRTAGLPFAVEELVALLRERGALLRGTGGGASRWLAEVDVPAGVRDPVLARLSRLSDESRSVVRAAAVLQAPVPLALLAATCDLAADRMPGALADALVSGLLVDQDGMTGFRHPLAAQAVYEDTPGLLRQRLHDRAATALAEISPTPLGQLAHHLRHAGRLASWVEAAEQAADQAMEVGHDDEAARLLEDLLRHAPLAADQRGQIAVKLGRAALDTVHAPWQVTDLLAEVLAGDLPRGVRGELKFRLALLIGHTGVDPRGGRRMVAEAIADLPDDSTLKAWATAVMAIRAVAEMPPVAPEAWLERAMTAIPRLEDPVLAVFLLGKVAATQVTLGDPAWRNLVGQIDQHTAGAPRRRREVHAYYMVGATASFAGHHEIADRMLNSAITGVAYCENRRLELLLQAGSALLNLFRGCWHGLPETAERLIDELADYPPALIDIELVAGSLAVARGDFAPAHAWLSAALARADKLADYLFLPLGLRPAIQLALARGDVDAALAHADRLVDATADDRIWAPFARVLPALTQALVTGERVGDARAAVRRWSRAFGGRDVPFARAALPHARGFLEAASRRWLAAAREFLAAAEHYASRRSPYETAQAREQAAVCLLRAGDARAARALADAMDTYQRIGASVDLDRARRTARQHGMPAPNRHRSGRRGYGDRLSPRELEVAELAALGRTNKEIAGELFLSPHTVDKHLRRALRKLGLRSRTVLAHELGASRADLRRNNGGSSP